MTLKAVKIVLIYALDTIFAEYDEGVEAVKGHVEGEVEEKLDVPLPDTIGKPLTVMIHSKDAPVALLAMVDSWWLRAFTVLTPRHVFLMDVAILILIQCDFGLTSHTRLHKFLIQMDCYSGATFSMSCYWLLIINDFKLECQLM